MREGWLRRDDVSIEPHLISTSPLAVVVHRRLPAIVDDVLPVPGR